MKKAARIRREQFSRGWQRMVWIGVVMLAANATVWAQNPLTATSIAAGGFHSLAVDSNGTVWACGYNLYGQLGDGTSGTAADRTPCLPVSGLSGVIAVDGGYVHSVARKNDGTVWTWGYNNEGQLGDGTSGTNRVAPVAVSGLPGVSNVVAGYKHTVALGNDGTVWSWGYNMFGQLGDGTSGTNRLAPVPVSGLSDVSQVDAGSLHTVALQSNGTVWAWGLNNYGQLGDGTNLTRSTPVQAVGLSNVTQVAAGENYTVALKSDGSVWAWGANWNGQLGDGTNIHRSTPVPVSGLSNVIQIAAGIYHTVALLSNGTVRAWGNNNEGQLGDGSTTPRYTPVQVQSLSGVVRVAAGKDHTLARKNDGTVWGCGANSNGQLGDGTKTRRTSPVQMMTFANNPAVAYAFRTVCAPNACVTNAPAYTDVDLQGTWTATVVSNAAHGTVVGGTNLVYTPTNGFTGFDSFTYLVNDGFTTSNVARVEVFVRPTGDPAGMLVAIVVNDLLYTVLSNEVQRLKTDLTNEGYTAVVTPFSSGASAQSVWTHLNSLYQTNWLAGALLIGNIAKIAYSGIYSDGYYWNMRAFQSTASAVASHDIWVGRFTISDSSYGTEANLIRFALDANHYYRTGQSRLPHTAYVHVGSDWGGDAQASNEVNKAKQVWTNAYVDSNTDGTLNGLNGSDLICELSHGNDYSYSAGMTTPDAHKGPIQSRTMLCTSCSSGYPDGVVNHQLFSRGGGNLISVGASTSCSPYNYTIFRDAITPTGRQADFRSMLAAGELWGSAMLRSFPLPEYDFYSGASDTMIYGDLSMKPLRTPTNVVPVVTSLYASKTTVAGGEPVTISVAFTDGDGAGENSPHVPFRHQVEWFMNGYNYGKNNPDYTTDDTQGAGWESVTHTFTTTGTYTVRAAVMDEWRAVAWQELTIVVSTPAVSCAITAPTNGASVTVGMSTTLTVTAATSYGTITNVEFALDGVVLGSDTNAPFTCDWTPSVAQVGARVLSAKAVNTQGNIANASVGLTVRSRVACVLTAPAAWTVVKAGTNLDLTATAESLDTGIAGVAFFGDGAQIGSDAIAPYSCVWSNVAAGSYSLTAVATDSNAQSGASEAVTLTVTASGGWEGVVATGGTVTNYALNGTNYRAHIFASTEGNDTFSVIAGGDVELLVVAGGGGGGGGWEGGGGGAGGLRHFSTNLPAATYTIMVGAGGKGCRNGDETAAVNGQPSSISQAGTTLVSATAGGRGSSESPTAAPAVGGSGGGGGHVGGLTGASGMPGEGNKGGDGANPDSDPWCTGGGGGAASAGSNGSNTTPGSGGAGTNLTLSGSLVTYATGGKGGFRSATYTGVDGAANTGNGGEGGGSRIGIGTGGNGGSGIVIVRYETGGGASATSTYTVAYHDNGANSGTAPASQTKTQNVAVVVSGNTGNLVKTSHTFSGWNTAANGNGMDYAAGASYTANAGVTLYAKWVSNAAPTISVQPSSASVTAGQTATFSVTATGTPTLVYQWFTNSTPISGATGTSYTTPATSTNDSGRQFQVTVSNAYGAVTSSVATLTVTATPTYTVSYDPNGATGGTAPASQTKTQNVAVVVSGNTGNLVKTSHTFAGWNTAANGGGTDYAAGASYTANADVTLYAKWTSNAAPTISVQPTSVSVTAGQSATFSVTATGTPTLVYQWFANSTPISGATGTSYTTPATTTNDSGKSFQVTVTNAFGAVTSSVATLTVNAAPTGGVVATGGTITNYTLGGTNWTAHIFTNGGIFTVTSTGAVEYLIIGGGGGGGRDSYGAANGGGSNGRGSGGGGAGGLLAGATSLTAQAYPITVGAGGAGATSQQGANGSNSIAFGLTAYGGGGGGESHLSAGLPGGSGGGGGHSTDGGAATNGQGYAGGFGNGAPSPYQGSGGGGAGSAGGPGTNGVGGTGVSSALSGVSTYYAGGGGGGGGGGPDVGKAGGLGGGGDGGGDVSNAVNGTDGRGGGGGGGGEAPASYTGGKGGSGIVIVRYVSGGGGSAPVSTYTVAYDGNGATGGTAPANQVKTQDVAVVVSGNTGNLVKASHTFAGWNTAANGGGTDYAVGASYTANADVTLYAKWTSNAAPTISVEPASVSVTAGATATFSVTATGSPTLVYQWFTNNAPISGATGASYTTPATTTNDSGRQFQVTVTNVYGAATSIVATLTVNAAPTGGVVATGGTITNYTLNGTNWTAHIFTNTAASTSLVFSAGCSVEVLVVAGGGGGKMGGGGAGGYVATSMLVSATSYQVVIGAGGNGTNGSSTANPNPGSNSTFGDIYAYGGGYGGGGEGDNASRKGGDGGSGGGAGIHGGASIAAGAATNGQGYAGGANGMVYPYPGGGGGGAASAGFTPDGGNGVTNSISGVAVGYAGGGGGGWYFATNADSSANCGGGAGRTGNGDNGTPGTGGGGGGGGQLGKGGSGGSGIVIVRYVTGGGGVSPATPTGFAATAAGTNRIDLAWMDNATNENGYLVARSTDSNAWTFVVLTAPNATNYSDTALATNTLYHYRVAASNSAGLSAYAYASTQTWTVVQEWQHDYFTPDQLTNTAVSGDTADPDGDGLMNWMERIAGTDPTNATSSLTVSAPTNSPVVAGKFVLCWPSVTGRTYTVMMATNLMTGFTNLMPTNIAATPPMNAYTDSVESAAGRYYRIRVE